MGGWGGRRECERGEEGVWEGGKEEGVWEEEAWKKEEGKGGGEEKGGSKLKQVSQLCHDTDLTTHLRVLPHRNVPSVHLYRRPLLNMHQNLVQRLITVALQHKVEV